MTMAFAREVMEMKLDPDHKNFPKVLSTKQAIASSILTATARVRDGLLRPTGDDGLGSILDRVRRLGSEDTVIGTLDERALLDELLS